ncbi:fimbrial protein [Serratia fonticola]|uniref:fimbrial protein n=2 Tax=Serratia TaxID=613 RepID=UPI000BFDF4F2|nr:MULTISPECIES: fimbrial protein [Serratia]ATM79170.1 fimbrial protein [Serratia fonticola]MCO7508641.1 type 1 fimbrial protein [Serratia fonticola]MDQ7212076.1 fimbrial protein [Serratia fonticola]NCG52478.1 type 1 fimbrial protein [Serratia fonticola]HBE9082524.1 type 1 fimbrial protein [Serratia fonticola]
MVPVVIGSMLALMPEAGAADNWNVDGANGVLHVRGALTESACRLEMTSAYQDVWLGETGTARLAQIGAQGTPVAVRLRLQDCLRTPANNRDERNGNLLWSAHQPAVSLSFVAPADADNPQLIAVRGASGVALRMVDQLGRDIRLGSRGAPLMLAVGQDQLDYVVKLERTRAPLQAGAYSAHVDFRLNYD